MSMLSAQCDELRAMAASVGLAVPQAATLMMDAADTISELRDQLQARTTHAIIVSDESTDCATGHCECELCGEPIDPWDRFCRHCGAGVVDDG